MPDNKEPQTVTLSAAQWAEIQATLKSHDKALFGSPVVEAEKPEFRTLKVTMIDGQPVIGFVNRGTPNEARYVYAGRQNPDFPNEFIDYVDVLVRNPKGGEPMCFALPYTQFLRESQRAVCKILKTNQKEVIIDQGVTSGRTYAPDTYHMNEAGRVPLRVKIIKRTYDVQLPDGSTLEGLDEAYVNMAG